MPGRSLRRASLLLIPGGPLPGAETGVSSVGHVAILTFAWNAFHGCGIGRRVSADAVTRFRAPWLRRLVGVGTGVAASAAAGAARIGASELQGRWPGRGCRVGPGLGLREGVRQLRG